MGRRVRSRGGRRARRDARRAGSGWRRLVRRGLLCAFGAWVGANLAGVVALAALSRIDPPTTALQIQRRLEAWLTGRHYRRYQRTVPLSAISPHLRHAVIVAEDGRFYAHAGIDWKEIDKLVHSGEIRRGASTIPQQLVKNLFFGTHLRWLGKGFELTLAPAADALLSKDRILELYLNVVEWDDGVYGASAAATRYYGIPAVALDRDRSARLAACLPAPRTRRPERMDEYSAIILQRMAARGW